MVAPVEPPDQGAFPVFEWLVAHIVALAIGVVGGLSALLGVSWRAGWSLSALRADIARVEARVDARIDAAEARLVSFEIEFRRLGDKIDANHNRIVQLILAKEHAGD